MAESAEIVFTAQGVREVLAAFDSVDARMAKFERGQAAAAEGGAKATRRAVDEQERAYKKLVADIDREKKKEVAAAEKAAAQEAVAAEKSAAAQAKAAEKAAAAKERADARAYKEAEKYLNQEVRAVERAEQAKTRAAEREAARREAIVRRSSEMAGRIASQQARSELAHDRRMGGVLGGAAKRGLGGLASGAMSLAGTALTIGGGFAIADFASGELSLDHEVGSLQNSARIAGANPRRQDIIARATEVQASSGVSRQDLIKGWQEYVKLSSDFGGGGDNLEEFAKLSKATGTDFSELMKMAGNFRVQNKNLKTPEMLNLLRNVIGQGGAGAMEIEDLAKYGGEITSTSGSYGGNQTANQQKLLGLAQIARRVTDVAESATSVKRLATDVSSNAGKMEAAGVKVRDDKGMLLDPADIIANLMGKTGGDVGKLKKLGIGRESMNLFSAMRPTFNDAGGGAAGTEAVRKEIADMEGKGITPERVDELLRNVMEEPGERIKLAWEKLETAGEESLAPLLTRLAEKLPEIIPVFEQIISGGGRLAEWFIDNPIKGVGAVVAAKVGADVMGAGIGEAIKGAIAKAGTGGNIAITGAVLEIAMATMVIEAIKTQQNTDAASSAAATQGRNDTADILAAAQSNSGPLSPDEIKTLKARRAQIDQQIAGFTYDKAQNPFASPSNFLAAGQAGLDETIQLFGGDNPEKDRATRQVPKLQKEAADIDAALGRYAKAHEESGAKVEQSMQRLATNADKASKALEKVVPPGGGDKPDPNDPTRGGGGNRGVQ